MGDTRKIGIPYGRTEYVEQITRTVHPDATVTDSPPERVPRPRPGPFQDLARALAREDAPIGTHRVLLQRTVITEATEWTEVPRNEPDTASDVRGD